MGNIQINIEITDIMAGSCEVLVVGWDLSGASCVLDAQQCEWPVYARTWRSMMDSWRRWILEAVPDDR